MPKPHGSKKQHVLEVDPVVVKVQETLEENLTYFIDNIAGLVRRYDGLLGRALQLNKGTASEIAQLQSFLNEADNNNTNTSKTSDDAAPPTSSQQQQQSNNNNNSAAASSANTNTTDNSNKTATTAPLIKQVNTTLPTSPLLKRAASPLSTGDSKATTTTTVADTFPSVDKDAKKVEQDASSSAITTTTTKKSSNSNRKVRIIEVKFPDNTEIVKQLRQLKRESYELGATMDGIHDWIALNVPDMKDDENDGVEVMGAVIEQVTSLTDTVRSVYAAESKYLEERAELEKSMLKLPESETMKLAIKSHDADSWDEVDRGWRTLIRVCLLLYSILSKNMAMLKEPRKKSNTSSAMFM